MLRARVVEQYIFYLLNGVPVMYDQEWNLAAGRGRYMCSMEWRDKK